MKRLRFLFPVIFLFLATLLFPGCENYIESDEINGLVKINDLSLNMKVEGGPNSFRIEKIDESDKDYYLKIDVTDTFSVRSEAAIKPGDKYKLSFTLKNHNANPVINYLFWEMPKTSLRHYTFKGENGSPPTSETQKLYDEWTTFEETFETSEGEDSFMLTLHSGEGIFFIKEINIERMQE